MSQAIASRVQLSQKHLSAHLLCKLTIGRMPKQLKSKSPEAEDNNFPGTRNGVRMQRKRRRPDKLVIPAKSAF